jgi:hypothetical protein
MNELTVQIIRATPTLTLQRWLATDDELGTEDANLIEDELDRRAGLS